MPDATEKNILKISLPGQFKVCLLAMLLTFIQIPGESNPFYITSHQGDTKVSVNVLFDTRAIIYCYGECK